MINIAKYFSLLLGLLYCIFIVWNRLIRERFPRDLFTNYSTSLLYVYGFLCIICLYIVIYNIRIIFNITPKYKILNKLLEIPLVNKISNKIVYIWDEYIANAPKNLYEYLYYSEFIRNIIPLRQIVNKLCYYMYYFVLRRFIHHILILRNSFQCVIVIPMFIYSIFVQANLMYFYKCLPFLLLPTLFDLLLFIIFNLALKNLKLLNSWLILTFNGTAYEVRINYENKDNPFLNIEDEQSLASSVKRNGSILIDYNYACVAISEYYKLEKKVKPYIYLYIFASYTIGWGYILFNILF